MADHASPDFPLLMLRRAISGSLSRHALKHTLKAMHRGNGCAWEMDVRVKWIRGQCAMDLLARSDGRATGGRIPQRLGAQTGTENFPPFKDQSMESLVAALMTA